MLESLQKELSKIGSNIAREILVSACDTAAKYDAELARRVRIFLGPESEDAPALKKRTPPPANAKDDGAAEPRLCSVCNKKLRSDNTKGVCAGCQSKGKA